MRLPLFLLLSLFLFSFEAKATTITPYTGYTATIVDPSTIAPGGHSTIDFDEPGTTPLSQYGSMLYTGHPEEGVSTLETSRAAIVEGSNSTGSFQYAKPAGLSDTANYLAVFGSENQIGSAKFTLREGMTNFSFLWSSIDEGNWIEVESKGGSYSIFGKDILKILSAASGSVSQFFSLTDLSGILSVTLYSRNSTFEMANASAVPLPAAGLLFGTALLGLTAYRRRKAA